MHCEENTKILHKNRHKYSYFWRVIEMCVCPCVRCVNVGHVCTVLMDMSMCVAVHSRGIYVWVYLCVLFYVYITY